MSERKEIQSEQATQQKLAYSPKEVAQLLGIGKALAYQLCHQEDFPCITVGNRFVIPADGLTRWLEKAG